jgi:aryl-alcohol dehydrogenase-like predicted oxidoreductase
MNYAQLEHSPTLATILMVEETLSTMDESVITVAQLKRMLPKQVNHQMLKIILQYLEESNKIAVSIFGISWIAHINPNLKSAIIAGKKL